MALTVFDWIKQVTYTKAPWTSFTEEEQKTFNVFMVNRFISMYEPYIELANSLQQLWQLTPEQVYLIYCSYLPKKSIFAKYIKSTKPKLNKDLLSILATHYKVSTREIKEYMNILDDEDIKMILQQRGCQEDDINKLLNNEKTTKKSKVSKRS